MTQTNTANKVFALAHNIVSPLGFTSAENFQALRKDISGLKIHNDLAYLPEDFCASLLDWTKVHERFELLSEAKKFSRFEQIAVLSIADSLKYCAVDTQSPRTLLVFSTTKGSIDILDPHFSSHLEHKRLKLWESAAFISRFFNNPNEPLLVSNACVSGVLAVIIARRLLLSGAYDHAIVCGADIVTNFVVSGFHSFKALSQSPCRPFDKNRKGLNLGEAAGTLILSAVTSEKKDEHIVVGQGFTANDATHISAPSRTGEGLYGVLSHLKRAEQEMFGNGIDFISAHGTATLYNDDMEATALTRANLKNVPVNSFKGYWGHTLGAAGLIEIIATLNSLENNILFKTAGYESPGTVEDINIISKTTTHKVNRCLKLASGFGGCNAGVILHKDND